MKIKVIIPFFIILIFLTNIVFSQKYFSDDVINEIIDGKRKVILYPKKFSRKFTGKIGGRIYPNNTKMIIKVYWNKKKLSGYTYVPKYKDKIYITGLMDTDKNIYFRTNRQNTDKPGIGYDFHGKIIGIHLEGYFSKGSGKKGFGFTDLTLPSKL